MTKFAFIHAEKADHPDWEIVTCCRLLGVSRSGYYAWRDRPPSARSVADAVLTEQVVASFTASRRTYGSPRIHADLAEAGVRVGRKRVARLMRNHGIEGVHRRRRRWSSTVADPVGAAAVPDLVARRFQADAPNRLWVADVTYVPTVAGWLYLATVIDVFSRRVIGWSMNSNHTGQRGQAKACPTSTEPLRITHGLDTIDPPLRLVQLPARCRRTHHAHRLRHPHRTDFLDLRTRSRRPLRHRPGPASEVQGEPRSLTSCVANSS